MGRPTLALVRVVGGLNAAWLVALIIILFVRDRLDFGQGLPLPLTIALALPVLTSALAVVLIVLTAIRWRRRDHSRTEPLGDVLFVVAALAFIPFLASWNLFGVSV